MKLTLNLRSYVANPYWPEQEFLISVQRGIHPKLGDDKKQAALEAQLDKLGSTMEQYEAAQAKVKNCKFYRLNNDDLTSPIIIPRANFLAAMTEACSAPKAIRIADKETIRTVMNATDFVSNKTKRDTVYERIVRGEDSHQPRLMRDDVLQPVSFVGEIDIDPDIDPDDLKRFLEYAAKRIGFGACRKMGYGFGTVELN